MIRDIEDNYPEYLDDELGYAWDAWDILPADVIRRHDALVAATQSELADIDPAGLDDLDRWAYARACRRAGDIDGFLEAARLVLASEQGHRGLNYPDVYVATIQAMARAERIDEANLHLEQLRERWPEDTRSVRLAVFVASVWDVASAREALNDAIEHHQDDAELLFEIAEDLHVTERPELCREALLAVEAAAERTGATAVLVDVTVFREKLTA